MHEIEDLVQTSVELLDRHHPADDGRLRDWFTALFAFQNDYDCSHTQHRVMEILIRRGHTVRFPIAEHPDYAARKDFFDGIEEFTPLREFGADEQEFAGELEDGYVDPPWLYCEAATALWQRMNCPATTEAPLLEVVVAVAEAAERDGDAELIGCWWSLGWQALVGGQPFSPEELAATPGVAELRAIVRRTGAQGFGSRPSEEQLELMGDELETWWYRL
ncbi:hypothetical protein SAMN04489716_3579 [Actinoplanes derwentensis]|uniref:Uncharacterized protein n=2 Tax=Actinoplanes derwentensis TaxID=113562 RepID=A0A1H1ZZC5_9ACTN|nr:hypothetical protein SAMN04489716_3579 [Actinoplanes derwentensis]